MHRTLPTEDGSVTLYVPELNEPYHSVHGAIRESRHIFIRAGLEHFLETHPHRNNRPLRILEAGFGTGLNAWLTLLKAEELPLPVSYHSIEKYPLSAEETECLNYPECTGNGQKHLFYELHRCPWEIPQALTARFTLCKHRQDFREIGFPPSSFDIVYFDAFRPDVQPHLWTAAVFERFYQALVPEGILVTYSVKGTVKQALRAVGFTLKRLPGPPGKREMLRATKHEKSHGPASDQTTPR